MQCQLGLGMKTREGWEMDGMNDTNDPTYLVERYCMIL